MAVITQKKLALVPGDRPLIFSSSLRQMFGPCAAALLQQVHFWCETHPNHRDGQAWCYNTQEQWAEQIEYSTIAVRKAVKKLTDSKVLVCGRFNKLGYDRTLWYRIDHAELDLKIEEYRLNRYKVSASSDTSYPLMPIQSIAPIPEMNTEITPEINSASAKAVKTFLYPEEPTGKENRKLEKLKELIKQGTPVMSKKELLAIPAHSDLPVKKHHNLAEQVGTGEMKMATAKEIMAAQSAKDANTHRLPTLWLKHRYAVTGVCQKPLTVREMAQLKMFSKYMGELAEPVMMYALNNWWKFVAEAKSAKGFENAPMEPEPGFMLKCCETVANQYLQSIAKPAKIVAKPVPVVLVPVVKPGVTYNNLGEEIYKPSQAEINAFFD